MNWSKEKQEQTNLKDFMEDEEDETKDTTTDI